jgi:citrate lyase beta subunit
LFIVRVNALDTGLALDDLAAAVKVSDAVDLERIGHLPRRARDQSQHGLRR